MDRGGPTEGSGDTARSYARLSVAHPSQGGTVSFLDRAFGPGMLSGSANVLLWISYIVMLSLYAYAFGAYGAELIPGGATPFWRHALTSGVLVGITALNLLSAKLVGEAEDVIVGVKLTILLLFIVVGFWGVDGAQIAPSTWAPPLQLVAGGMIIFVAYEGFELIANASEDVTNPERTLPRAFYSSVGFVLVLYVLVAIVTVGTLPVDEIVAARDYALAAAALPFLGDAGRVLIAVAAVLSTASAINATLYGAAELCLRQRGRTAHGAREEHLEPTGGGPVHHDGGRPAHGHNLVDLSNMSSMGSAGFLLIFADVNAADARLSKGEGQRRWIAWSGMTLCLLALLVLLGQTWLDAPARLGILGGMVALAVGVEGLYRDFGRHGDRASLR